MARDVIVDLGPTSSSQVIIGRGPAGPTGPVGPAVDVTNLVHKNDLVFNVKDHGATGDNSTDDTAALATVLALAGATVAAGIGATVYFPRGTYKTTGITLPDNVRVRGAGRRGTRIQGIGAVTALSFGTGNVVSDLHVRGDSVAGSVGVKRAYALASRTSFEDCHVTGHEVGVHVADTFIVRFDRVVIQSCTTGLLIEGADVNAVAVTGGEIQGCVNGVATLNASASTNVTFRDACIEGNSGYGVKLDGFAYGLHFRDSYFEANTAGHIYSASGSKIQRGMSISGCTFSGTAAFSINLYHATDLTIEGCVFNLTSGGRPITLSSACARVEIGVNWYAASQTLAPSTDILTTTDVFLRDPRFLTMPKGQTAHASFNIPPASAVPAAPVAGDVWFTPSGMYYQKAGATVGPLDTVFTSTTGNLENIASTINTTDKKAGKSVFNTVTGRPVWTTGAAAASVWKHSDGTTAHTPV